MRERSATGGDPRAAERWERLTDELSALRRLPASDRPAPDGPAPDQPDATRITQRRWQQMAPVAPGEPTTEPTPAPALAPAPAPDLRGVPELPRPGRHASRRAGAEPGWVPPALRGRVGLAPAHVAVLALAVAAALALCAWWVLDSRASPIDPVEVATPDPDAAVPGAAEGADDTGAAAGGSAPAPAPGAAGAPTEVVVHVDGDVKRPGVVVLPAGSRVRDALDAAGGVAGRVDLASLNLARVLVDGEQVLVGEAALAAPAAPGGAPPGGAGGGAAPPAAPGALVSINAATSEQLQELPGVGPVTAEAIVAWRTENGGFTSIDQLDEVKGIGPATLQELTPLVTL